MRCFLTAVVAFVVAAFCSGCAAPPRTAMLESTANYEFSDDGNRTVFITFSGGGMRAAALAYGVLKELNAQEIKGKNNLIDEVDLVSSVSGGSVTAAYWALKGSGGFEDLEDRFLKQDIHSAMIAKGIVTLPWTLLVGMGYNRIDLLIEHFEDLFGEDTYGTLIRPDPAENNDESANGRKRPHLVINATDMATGYIFSFTQHQFDLICADLTKMRLADAVAASAAYPVFLTALSLKNHSPCDVPRAGWKKDNKGRLRPKWLTKDLGLSYDKYPRKVLRARRALEFLNEAEDGERNYLHLLDGGIVDNLGLSLPLSLFAEEPPSNDGHQLMVPMMVLPILLEPDDGNQNTSPASNGGNSNQGKIRRCAIFVVNARSNPDSEYGKSSTPPGIKSTISSSVGAAVDSTSLLLTDKAMSIPGASKCKGIDGKAGVSVVRVDFESIGDNHQECRRKFHNISTSWVLSDQEVEGLIMMGAALLRQSEKYRDLVKDLGGTVKGEGERSIEAACASLSAVPVTQ